MTQVTARLSAELVRQIDETARRLKRSRAELIRQAIEYYLYDVEDLRLDLEQLNDPADPALDWDEVKVTYSLRVKQSAAEALQRG